MTEVESAVFGDFCGSLSKSADLFSMDGFPQTLDSFHQAYMPSNAVVRAGIKRLRDFQIDLLFCRSMAPSSRGHHVKAAFSHLESLPCGVDLPEAMRRDA